MERCEIHPVSRSALAEVAAFLHHWRNKEGQAHEEASSIERRLNWLLLENPTAAECDSFGYCVRDGQGAVKGLNLAFPVAFAVDGQRLLALCSGSFFVDPPARSMGFYLFKKVLNTPGYAFQFAATCNANSSELWKSIGACAVPNSDFEYILPLRLDVMFPAYVANRTSSEVASGIASICGRGANPLLRLLTRPSPDLNVEPCQDWEKLSELAARHKSASHIASARSAEYLKWRYGPGSPLHPCSVYLLKDKTGNEGWFALGGLKQGQVRESVLLDVIWPRAQMNFRGVFRQILRSAADQADSIQFRWQPGLDFREYSRWIIPCKLPAPRAYVKTPKGGARLALEVFDYDDSDSVAWKFDWRNK